MITDGHIVSPRAGFELSEKMADGYREIVMQCIANGWLKPVAYVKESEFVWEALNE